MNKQIYVVAAITLLFVSIFGLELYLTGSKEKNNTNKEEYIIHYYSNNSLYDIETNNNTLLITKKDVIECVTTPCDPIVVDSFKIKYKEEYQELIKELCKEEKEITISTKDLNDNQLILLNEIVKEDNKKDSITYKVIESIEDDSNYEEHGYYLEEEEKVILTISSGLKNTGGYTIQIKDIKVDGNDIEILVEEENPPEDAIVTMAFTCPIVQIELSKIPDNITVQNINTNEYLKEIDNK